jgi:hypothetical protein
LTVTDRRSSCRGRSKDTRFPFFSDPFKQYLYPAFLFCGGRQGLGCPPGALGRRDTAVSSPCDGRSKCNGKLPDLTAVEIGWRCRRGCWRTGGTVQPPLATRAEGLAGTLGTRGFQYCWTSAMRRTGRASSSGEGEKKRCACNPRTPPHISLLVVRPELPLPSPPPFHSHPYCYSPPGAWMRRFWIPLRTEGRCSTNTDSHRQRDCGAYRLNGTCPTQSSVGDDGGWKCSPGPTAQQHHI